MSTLVACLSTGKGTWGHVSRLIEDETWDKVILITNDYGKENFKKKDNVELISVNLTQGIRDLITEIETSLKYKITDTEVAVNFISGTGKEHMALISALLKSGLGIRLIALTSEGIKEI